MFKPPKEIVLEMILFETKIPVHPGAIVPVVLNPYKELKAHEITLQLLMARRSFLK